jgi:AcrR family transcriptional regulator
MQPRGRKKELRGNARQRELTASLVALLEEGRRFGDIAIEDITRRAGITRAAFYYFFESKEQVLLAAMGEFSADIHEAARPFFESTSETPRPELEASLSAIARVRRVHEPLVRAFSEAAASDEKVWSVLENLYEGAALRVAARITRIRAARRRPISQRAALSLARTLVWMNERNLYRLNRGPATKADWDDLVESLTEIWIATVEGAEIKARPK